MTRVLTSARGIAMQREGFDNTYPLSSVQQAIWLDQMTAMGEASYNIGLVTRVDGPFDTHTYKSAVDAVAMSRDALRLVLCEGTEMPMQRICQSIEPAIELLDFSQMSNPEEAVRQHFNGELDRPIDMQGQVLWDTQILRASSARHYLVRRYHHLITDGLGVAIVGEAVIDTYNRLRQGVDVSRLAACPYVNFIRDDQAYLVSQKLERDRKFWRQYLSEPPASIIRRSSPSRRGHEVRHLRCSIKRRVFEEIVSLGRAYSFTLAHFMLALLCAYFSKVVDQKDIVIGYPVHNRTTPERKRTVGMFSSVIPLKLRVDPDKSFIELISSASAELRRCYRHQNFPIPEISRALNLSHLAGQRLFDTMLSIESFGVERAFDEAGQRVVETRRGIGCTPLVVSIRDYHQGDEVIIGLDYNNGLVDHELIVGMQRRLPSFLEAIAADITCPLRKVSVMDLGERTELLQEVGRGSATQSRQLLAHRSFESQVSRDFHAVAVAGQVATLSYGELNRKANKLARYLRTMGAKPGVVVAVCMERSADFVVALLGVLKSGASFLPIDPSYPPERITYMVEDSAPLTILTQQSLVALFSSTSSAVLACDDVVFELGRYADFDLPSSEVELLARHVAYVIYTSGSTGKPKAIAMPHKGLANLILWHADQDAWSKPQRTAQFAAIGFDVALQEIFATLCTGGSLIPVAEEVRRDPQALADLLRRAMVERVFLPFSAFQGLAEYLRLSGLMIPSLQDVITAGEQLRISPAIEEFFQRNPTCRLHNHYGPAETHVVTAYTLPQAPEDWPMFPPIGRPIANTQIYVLDDRMEPVPIGSIGEIYVGGDGVAQGYLNQPKLTAERFILDPFSRASTLYRTGDIGRWRADGLLEFLERNDNQIKIRGYRIEPGEIEVSLCAHPKVTGAAVVGREDGQGGKRLVAYFTCSKGDVPTAEVLRGHLRQMLPDYMVPSTIVHLEEMPVSPNGKLDSSALPVPAVSVLEERHFEPPVGRNEELLADIWGELLGLQRIGRHDNFFDLGGHSLMIMQVVGCLHNVGVHANVSSFFTSQSLLALAETLVDMQTVPVAAAPSGIPEGCKQISPEMLTLVQLNQSQIAAIVRSTDGEERNIQDIYPLTSFQEGLLFHSVLEDDADPYIVSVIFSTASRPALDALLGGLQSIVDRHDLARSSMAWRGLPHPVQIVYRKAQLPIEVIDLDPERDPLGQMQDCIECNLRSIDVRRAPLMRTVVGSSRQADEHWLLFQFHHLVVDHVSLEIMQDEIRSFLAGSDTADLTPVPFRHFIAQRASTTAPSSYEDYFRRNFAGLSEWPHAFGLPDVYGSGRDTREAVFELDEALSGRLRAAVRGLGVSVAAVFHVGWALVLSRSGAGNDVVFGTVFSGRLQADGMSDRMFGNCINTLPVRMRFDSTTPREDIVSMHGQLGELVKYEQVPLTAIQRCVRGDAGGPLFTAVLNYRHSKRHYLSRRSSMDSAALGVRVLAVKERSNYPLGLQVDDLGQSFVLTLQADACLDPGRIAASMRTALEGIVVALECQALAPTRSISVLPDAERERLVYGKNDRRTASANDRPAYSLVDRIGEHRGGADAIVSGDRRLSWEQLDVRSSGLAHALRWAGVKADVVVGVGIGRTVEFAIGVLAILKAGGAFLPLDPELPSERLLSMCNDAGVRIIVVEQGSATTFAGMVEQTIDVDSGDLRADNVKLEDLSTKLAYVVFTSGSSGRPKGVAIEHHSLVSFLSSISALASLPAGARLSWWCSPNFDVSIYELFVGLVNGHTIHIVPDEVRLDARLFVEWLSAEAIEGAYVPPHALPALLEVAGEGVHKFALKHLLVGVEPIPEGLLCQLRSCLSGVRIVNAYGPTEATICTTGYIVPESAQHTTAPIGEPLGNVRTYVLDGDLEPVPYGVAGELYIGGAGVARGYVGRPDLTDKVFLPSPFVQGDRLYKTGDLVRLLDDGNLAFLGRLDRQVKIRGNRVELDEIAEVLMRHPEVSNAMVLMKLNRSDEAEIVAYIVSSSQNGATGRFREHLLAQLPTYMVPSRFVVLGTLPVTRDGKIDIWALPDPAPDTDWIAPDDCPQGALETAVARAWSEILGIENVGRHDNFFDLGGHSLLAVRLLGRLQDLTADVSLRMLVQHPTVASLCQCIVEGGVGRPPDNSTLLER